MNTRRGSSSGEQHCLILEGRQKEQVHGAAVASQWAREVLGLPKGHGAVFSLSEPAEHPSLEVLELEGPQFARCTVDLCGWLKSSPPNCPYTNPLNL